RERDQRAAQVIDMLNSFVRTLATADTEMSMTNLSDVSAFLDEASSNVDALLLDHPELASKLHTSLSIAFVGRSDLDAAEREIRKALAIESRTPTAPGARRDVEQALGRVLWKQGRYDEAEGCYRRALEFDAPAQERARTHHHLAATLQQLMRFDEAEAHWREALRLRHETLASDDPEILNSRNGLAVCRLQEGETSEAATELESVLASIRAYGIDNDFRVARVAQNLARADIDLGRLDEAEALLLEASSIIDAFFSGETIERAPVEHELARIALKRGESTDRARRAWEIRRHFLGETHHETLESAVLMAQASGDLEAMRAAVDALASALPEGNWQVALALEDLGVLEEAHGDATRARAAFERALRDLQAHRPLGTTDIRRVAARLAAIGGS
ncbi:MAG: tetratricopeptide repeat protein, partial [Phycisphaerales bacterium]|nr:tetratricopeptide repeat protein [Phycisphaerales bacterium]